MQKAFLGLRFASAQAVIVKQPSQLGIRAREGVRSCRMRRRPFSLWMVINRPRFDEVSTRLARISHGPVRNAHGVPIRHWRIGASREGFRPGKLLSKQLATGDLLTS